MSEPAGNQLRAAIIAVQRALDELGSRSMIIGGVAVLSAGVARLTTDVDATVAAGDTTPEHLLLTMARHGCVARIADAAAFARQSQVLLLRHESTRVNVDLTLAWLPFEEAALGRAREVDFDGIRLRVATPMDLVIYKMVASRPRDLDDAEKLLLLHPDIDVAYVREVVRSFAVVMEQPERAEALEALLEKVGRAAR